MVSGEESAVTSACSTSEAISRTRLRTCSFIGQFVPLWHCEAQGPVDGSGIRVGRHRTATGGDGALSGPGPVRAPRGLLHLRRVPRRRTALGRGADSGAGSALADVGLGGRGRAPYGGVPGAPRYRAGACVRRASGSVCGAGGALVPGTRGVVQHARPPRSHAGGDAASAAPDGPHGGWNRGKFACRGSRAYRTRRGAAFPAAPGLQRPRYQRLLPRRGTGGTEIG